MQTFLFRDKRPKTKRPNLFNERENTSMDIQRFNDTSCLVGTQFLRPRVLKIVVSTCVWRFSGTPFTLNLLITFPIRQNSFDNALNYIRLRIQNVVCYPETFQMPEHRTPIRVNAFKS